MRGPSLKGFMGGNSGLSTVRRLQLPCFVRCGLTGGESCAIGGVQWLRSGFLFRLRLRGGRASQGWCVTSSAHGQGRTIVVKGGQVYRREPPSPHPCPRGKTHGTGLLGRAVGQGRQPGTEPVKSPVGQLG